MPLTPEEAVGRARRIVFSGGALNNVLTDESVKPFEYLFRRLPEQGIHDPGVSFERPFKFLLGEFRVPRQMILMLFDLRPDIYRFSGIDPNDAVPFEARRFATQLGYEVAIDGNHPGELRFELEPIARQFAGTSLSVTNDVDALENPGFLPPNAAFEQARANRFGTAAGSGFSTLPQRPFRYGPESLPLTLLVKEGQTFSSFAIFFKPVLSPVAFIEWDMAGLLAPKNMVLELLRIMRPGVGIQGRP